MSIVDTFFGAGNDLDPTSLPASWSEELARWTARWDGGGDGGPAPLPRRVGDRLFWYVLMADRPQRRELEQLLQHWLGPAVSDVAVRRGALDDADPFDARLEDALPGRIARVEVLPLRSTDAVAHDANRTVVRERLGRLVELLEQRPARRPTQGRRLGAVLDDIYVSASDGDLASAMTQIAELEQRRLLDAPNNAFVRVRVTALASTPEELLASEHLKDLAGLALPARLAALVADAYVEVSASDPGASVLLASHLPEIVRQAVPALDTATLAQLTALGIVDGEHVALPQAPSTPEIEAPPGASPPDTAPADDEPVVATEDQDGGISSTELADPVLEATGIGGGLAANLAGQGKYGELLTLAQLADQIDLPDLYVVLLAARKLDTEDAARAGLELAGRHAGEADWGLFDGPAVIAALRERLEGISSWTGWADALAAGKAVDEDVLVDAADWEPMDAARLESCIGSASVEAIAGCIGAILASHRARLDVRTRGRVAVRLLEVLAFGGRSGSASRKATSVALEDVIDADLGADVRAEVISSVGLVLDEHLTAASADWALDILAELVDWAGGSDTTAIRQLVHELLPGLRRLNHVLGPAGWETLRGLAEQVDLELPPDLFVEADDVEAIDPLTRYAGKKVLIYSLREPPARQAAARLRAVCDADVSLAHDKAGSAQFQGRIEGADVIVMVTGAAKHAATNFIEDHVQGELIKLHQTGMSAILSALRAASL